MLPHIIIFNPDQWRSDVMGHLGNPAAKTPQIDALVENDAISFSNAFCQNTVCTPSRCSFMTGWYPHVRGHRTMYHMLHPELGEPNLLRILKQSGYFVWWGGKNDLAPGQDGHEPYCDVHFSPADEDYTRWGHSPQKIFGPDDSWRGDSDGDNYYSFFAGKLDAGEDTLYCDRDWANVLGAIDLIDNYEGSKPLCLYLPLTYPHPPYGVEDPWFSGIKRELVPERAPTPDDWSGKPSILKGIFERQNMQFWSEERWRELRAVYYGMCSRLDHQFGLLMSALKRNSLYRQSCIFLFSDHGDYTGDYGLVEKTQNTFEDCLSRVPFIVKPPTGADFFHPDKIRTGVSDALVELVDLSETVFDITGIDPGYSRFGRSLAPIIAGKAENVRDAAFCEGGRLRGELQAMEREATSFLTPEGIYWPRISLQTTDQHPYHTKATMCRTTDYKYVRRHYETDELYDLRNDPQELHNVIHDSRYEGILQGMKERMLTWYMETCDVVPAQTDLRGF